MSTQTDCCIILTTTNEQKVITMLTESLIESGLAGCIQVDEVQSYYKWEGKLHKAHEFRLMIKAGRVHYDEIVSLIRLKHNYQLPQIVKLDINNGSQEYIEWLLEAK